MSAEVQTGSQGSVGSACPLQTKAWERSLSQRHGTCAVALPCLSQAPARSVSRTNVPQCRKPVCVSCSLCTPPRRQWGCGACTAPACWSHERSMGNAAGGQGWLGRHIAGRPHSPQGRDSCVSYFHLCSPTAASWLLMWMLMRLRLARLFPITRRGQLLVTATARLRTAAITEPSALAAAASSSRGASPQHVVVPVFTMLFPSVAAQSFTVLDSQDRCCQGTGIFW